MGTNSHSFNDKKLKDKIEDLFVKIISLENLFQSWKELNKGKMKGS